MSANHDNKNNNNNNNKNNNNINNKNGPSKTFLGGMAFSQSWIGNWGCEAISGNIRNSKLRSG